MERLDFSNNTKYDPVEAAIHLNRYGLAKPFCKGARVLDAACGEGYGSYLMKTWGARSVDGIDIDQSSVDEARKLFKDDGLKYTQGSVEKLPYEDHTFDLVVSLETMEHIDDPDAFLAEVRRVLKPGGTVILSCPNDNYYFEQDHAENPFHKRPYTFFEFKELAENHLGTHVAYYLAFALDGFINLPFERRTEPETSKPEDALGLFHYTQCDQALCVPQDRYLNQWNANYYVGVWGRMERANQYSVTVAPRETFIDHKDKDYDLLRHIESSQNRKNDFFQLKQQLETSNMELDRIRVLLDLTKHERDAANEQRQLAEARAESALARVESLESSRGVRLLAKLYSVKMKFKKIFHR